MKTLRPLFLPLATVIALLLWVTSRTLGPVALVLAGWVLLWPERRTRAGRTLEILLLLLPVLWILHQARWVVYPLVAGTLLAYILLPLVEWLVVRRVPRPVAVLLALLPLLCFAALTLLLLVPALVQQVALVVHQLPVAYANVSDLLAPLLSKLRAGSATQAPLFPPGGGGLPGADSSATQFPGMVSAAAQLPGAAGALPQPAWLQQLTQHAESVLSAAGGGLLGLGKGLGRIIPWLGVLLLTPVTAYYLLVDWAGIAGGVNSWLPERWRSPVTRLSSEIQTALRVYVRGQVMVAAAEAILFTVAFALAGLPNPVALGVLGGLLSLIPIVGFWLTALLVILSALTGPTAWPSLIKGGVGLLVVNVLEGQILVPRIQGRGLGLHPLAVLLGVLLFGTILGLPGMLLAVPFMGVLRALKPELRAAWDQRLGCTNQIVVGPPDGASSGRTGAEDRDLTK